MLRFLSIRNFIIVERMALEFQPGFTILTGETGAGKSILIDALLLVLGERSDTGQIRHGCDLTEVSAEFDITDLPGLRDWLHQHDLQDEDHSGYMVRRVVEASGRSRHFINGHPATLQQLRTAGEMLVEIHGQHAHQSLLRSSMQRDLLDAFSGGGEQVKAVAAAWHRWQTLQQRRIDREKNVSALLQEREQLSWQVRELSALNFSAGEWHTLQADHHRASHAASLMEAAQMGVECLSEHEVAALARINTVISRLKGVPQDAVIRGVLEMLDSARIQLQEVTHALERYQQQLEIDPQQLQEIEERLQAIHAAARKYHVAPDALSGLLDQAIRRLELLGPEDGGEKLATEEAAAREEYLRLARESGLLRQRAGAMLSQQVTASMQMLAMEGGEFSVSLIPLEQGNAHGLEQIEFQVSTHQGQLLKPLAKVASGGELSRISLAIQVIMSKTGTAPTLIFDEVDTGIGGGVAEIVGGLLRKLGQERQVMCVTHLPQVASAGDWQWRVTKSADTGDQGKVTSHIEKLDAQQRIEEIARMLGGIRITDVTRQHAAEMLQLHDRK